MTVHSCCVSKHSVHGHEYVVPGIADGGGGDIDVDTDADVYAAVVEAASSSNAGRIDHRAYRVRRAPGTTRIASFVVV